MVNTRVRFHGRFREYDGGMYVLVPAGVAARLRKDFPNTIAEKTWFEVEVEL